MTWPSPDRSTLLKVSAGWHMHLDVLVARMTGKELGSFWDGWSSLKQDYDGRIPACQVVIPAFGTLQGPFQITGIDYAGTHDGEATFEVSLASAGALSFLAAA